jgi:hypothetical protein
MIKQIQTIYIPDDHYGHERLHFGKDTSSSEDLSEDDNPILEVKQDSGENNHSEKELHEEEEEQVSLNQLNQEQKDKGILEPSQNSDDDINSDDDESEQNYTEKEDDIAEQTEDESPISNSFTNWAYNYLNDLYEDVIEDSPINVDQTPGNQFFDYITSNSERLCINYSGRRDNNGKVEIQSFWNYLSTIPRLKNLSTIAFRFLSYPTSEAAAERCFSSQARVAGRDRFKTSRILEEARVSFVLNQ